MGHRRKREAKRTRPVKSAVPRDNLSPSLLQKKNAKTRRAQGRKGELIGDSTTSRHCVPLRLCVLLGYSLERQSSSRSRRVSRREYRGDHPVSVLSLVGSPTIKGASRA